MRIMLYEYNTHESHFWFLTGLDKVMITAQMQ